MSHSRKVILYQVLCQAISVNHDPIAKVSSLLQFIPATMRVRPAGNHNDRKRPLQAHAQPDAYLANPRSLSTFLIVMMRYESSLQVHMSLGRDTAVTACPAEAHAFVSTGPCCMDYAVLSIMPVSKLFAGLPESQSSFAAALFLFIFSSFKVRPRPGNPRRKDRVL